MAAPEPPTAESLLKEAERAPAPPGERPEADSLLLQAERSPVPPDGDLVAESPLLEAEAGPLPPGAAPFADSLFREAEAGPLPPGEEPVADSPLLETEAGPLPWTPSGSAPPWSGEPVLPAAGSAATAAEPVTTASPVGPGGTADPDGGGFPGSSDGVAVPGGGAIPDGPLGTVPESGQSTGATGYPAEGTGSSRGHTEASGVVGGELEISRGGVVAVDTESLRAVAARMGAVLPHLENAASQANLAAALTAPLPFDLAGVNAIVVEARTLSDRVTETMTELRHTADVYELVELQAQYAMLAAGAGGAVAVRKMRGIRERVATIGARSPEAARDARRLREQWRAGNGDEMRRQAKDSPWAGLLTGSSPVPWGSWLMGASTGLLLAAVNLFGAGVVPRNARLQGRGEPVKLRQSGAAQRGTAPETLGAAVKRIPGHEGPQVRVERLTMPGGTKEFSVYIAGTRSWSLGGKEPWDQHSNMQLYTNRSSSAYLAVRQALREAGAQPGSTVHAFGFSQGGMVAGRLALEGEFNVKNLVTAGAPIEAQTGEDTRTFTFRHADDPFAALSDGGSAVGPGSDDSLVVERTYDPESGVHDLEMEMHSIEAYAETAEMLEESGDPRAGEVRELLDELGSAEQVEVFEFNAERPENERDGQQDGERGRRPGRFSASSSEGAG